MLMVGETKVLSTCFVLAIVKVVCGAIVADVAGVGLDMVGVAGVGSVAMDTGVVLGIAGVCVAVEGNVVTTVAEEVVLMLSPLQVIFIYPSESERKIVKYPEIHVRQFCL